MPHSNLGRHACTPSLAHLSNRQPPAGCCPLECVANECVARLMKVTRNMTTLVLTHTDHPLLPPSQSFDASLLSCAPALAPTIKATKLWNCHLSVWVRRCPVFVFFFLFFLLFCFCYCCCFFLLVVLILLLLLAFSTKCALLLLFLLFLLLLFNTAGCAIPISWLVLFLCDTFCVVVRSHWRTPTHVCTYAHIYVCVCICVVLLAYLLLCLCFGTFSRIFVLNCGLAIMG